MYNSVRCTCKVLKVVSIFIGKFSRLCFNPVVGIVFRRGNCVFEKTVLVKLKPKVFSLCKDESLLNWAWGISLVLLFENV